MRFATVAAVAGLLFACSHGSASSSTTPPADAQANSANPPAPPAGAQSSAQAPGQPMTGDSAQAAGQGMTPDDAQAAEEVRDHHRHHHHGGVMMFIALSLDTLGTEQPQKADQVKQIQATLRQQMRPARDAERNVLAALADGVASGQVDSGRLSAAVEEEATQASAVHEASLDALNQLHQLLSPEERAALLEKVRAHFEVWRQVNANEDEGAPHSHLQHLARALNLSPEQVERIEGALRSNDGRGRRDPSGIERRVQAFETAFSGDSFDARSLQANRPDRSQFASPAERMVRFYQAVTPVLTQEQRQTLASRLRDRANDRPQNMSSNEVRQ
jgi:Spy/CpxP family protein refolding chaperone